MVETISLFAILTLLLLINELTAVHTREWGENFKSFF